jgi:hypothetical protein
MGRRAPVILPLLLIALLVGCTGRTRLDAVPADNAEKAVIAGIPEARFYLAADGSNYFRMLQASIEREAAHGDAIGAKTLPPAYYLAVSGGGENGAFGAGLLVGWTKHGDRPPFKIVTGISTGALIAPLAFLGSEYDGALKDVYTGISQDDVFSRRSLLAALTDDALADTTPLYDLISKYVNEELLKRIAEEYHKGRLLLIATTNLDIGKAVIWNIGAIAESGNDKALEIIRRVLLASAAIPGEFPPVMFDVELNGQAYQEMHVDGGAVAQEFLYPPTLHLAERSRSAHMERHRAAYVIRNGKIVTDWSNVRRWVPTIAGRAVSILINNNGVNDTYRIYATALRDGVDFNLAYIDSDFDATSDGMFDPVYMSKLFDHGYQAALQGYPWHKAPPGF